MNSRGETENYASEVFQSKLGVWFNPEVVAQARNMVATAIEAQTTRGAGLSQIAEIDVEEDDAHVDGEDEDNSDPDEPMQHSIASWDQAGVMDARNGSDQASSNAAQYQASDYAVNAIKQRVQAPELRRTFSMPNPLQMRNQSMPEVPTLKAFQASNRPQALDMKAIQDHNRYQMPQGPPNSSNPEYRALTIGDSEEVIAFLETRFRQLQQLVCKIVAKAWIKVIEPKKQTRFPYNKGVEAKPLWWPESVRHREPDHLKKPERIILLMTMLRCGNVPINRLELATAEVAAFIPPDKTNLLREIYRVAREEERFRCNEISGDTRIFVAATALVDIAALEDLVSPSTAGLRGSLSSETLRSATIHEASMALQRSNSQQTPQYDVADPFAESEDGKQGYTMLPPQNFYYAHQEQGYAPYPNVAVVTASQQALSSQSFQQAQQPQMYASDHNQARRLSSHVPSIDPNSYGQSSWPQNVDHQTTWSQSPLGSNFYQQPPVARQPQQQQIDQPPHQSPYYARGQSLETPAKQMPNVKQEHQNARSSPYLPTPMRPDANFPVTRGGQGVSFSDYLQSPRTAGPGLMQEEEHGDGMNETYH